MNIKNEKYTEQNVKLFNDTFSGKTSWDIVVQGVPNMVNYNSLNDEGEVESRKYGVVVNNVDLMIDHRQIMKSGMDYIIEKGKSVDFREFLNEYHYWFRGFYPKVSNKQDIQKSGKVLSPDMTEQYQKGFVTHIGNIIDPNYQEETTTSFDDVFGSVSGSVES
jgi:hypothetical protein